jgi:cobalt-zinc-cadmium efflux system outer membrane protein
MLHKKLAKNICALCCMYFLQPGLIHAQNQITTPPQDTMRLEVKAAEHIFLEKNLQLLAHRYNIQSGKALVEQAKKWENPVLSTGQNIYTKQEGFFKHSITYDSAGHVTSQGEIYADVEQLIKTAGKRRKQVDIARTNVNIAEWEFNSTMRSLRLTLLTDLYKMAQLQGNNVLLADNLERLTHLLTAMKAQYNNGNIARKEYLRVQALMVTLQQNRVENARSVEDLQAELKTLLHVRGNIFIEPVLPESDDITPPAIGLAELLDSAKKHNTDYQAEHYQLQLQQQTLRLQKAMASPDLTVGTNFDQSSTYAPNYWGLNIGLPLPLWDRNKGNIKSAKFQVQAEEANMQQADAKLENDVMSAYKKLLLSAQLNSSTSKDFYKDYNELYKNIVEAFNKRQISMLEFLDYYGDYQNTRQQQLQQLLNLRLAKQELNDVVGVDVAN